MVALNGNPVALPALKKARLIVGLVIFKIEPFRP